MLRFCVIALLALSTASFGQLDPDEWKGPFRKKVLIRTHLLPYGLINSSGVSAMTGIEYRFGGFHSIGFDASYFGSRQLIAVEDAYESGKVHASQMRTNRFSIHADYRFYFPSMYRDYAYFRPYFAVGGQIKTRTARYDVADYLEDNTLNYRGRLDLDYQRAAFRMGFVFSNYFSERYCFDFSVGPTYGKYSERERIVADVFDVRDHRIEPRFGWMARFSLNILLNKYSWSKKKPKLEQT